MCTFFCQKRTTALLESVEERENDCRKYFMIKSPWKNVANLVGVEPASSWSTVGCPPNWATPASRGMSSQSIYLTILFISRQSSKRLTSICAHSYARNWQLPFLNHLRKPMTSWSQSDAHPTEPPRPAPLYMEVFLVTNIRCIMWVLTRLKKKKTCSNEPIPFRSCIYLKFTQGVKWTFKLITRADAFQIKMCRFFFFFFFSLLLNLHCYALMQ